MKFLLAALILTSTAFAGTPWENTEGKRIMATYVRLVDEVLYLEREGREYPVRLNQLNPESRKYALEISGAISALESSVAADRQFPERILMGVLDANPKLVEGRTLKMQGHIAQIEGQGNLRGESVTVMLQSGLRAELDFAKDMEGGTHTLRVEGGRVMLLEAASSRNPFPSVELLLEVGQPLVVRTRVERGELLVLNEETAEEEAPEPVLQSLAASYHLPERVYMGDVQMDGMEGISADEVLQQGGSLVPEGAIDQGDLGMPSPIGGTLGVAKHSGIRYKGKSQIQLADGRFVDAESQEAAGEIQISQSGEVMPAHEEPIQQPAVSEPRNHRVDFIYTGITFNGQRQVKLPDGRIMGEDEASELLATGSLLQAAQPATNIVRSELPKSSVVVKDETGYRIKLSGGGYAALDSPEGQLQLAKDRERDLMRYQIGGQTGNVQVMGRM